jgi:hypothetical protein
VKLSSFQQLATAIESSIHPSESVLFPLAGTHELNVEVSAVNGAKPDTANESEHPDFLTGKSRDAALVQAENHYVDAFAQGTGDWISQTFSNGIFTVGNSGQVRVDYLYDGGAYRGELALFSLEGLEAFAPGSPDFIQEVARRALSHSELGYVVIQDATEAARFSRVLPGDQDFNQGTYLGKKTVQMSPGTRFGLMLVPNGTVQEVLRQPILTKAKRPLFSLETANPNQAFAIGQIGDVTGAGPKPTATITMSCFSSAGQPVKRRGSMI